MWVVDELLEAIAHRPYPLPRRRWRMAQRWNDLLFAHWPVAAAAVAATLPDGLEVDTFDGSAWLGVVPFWMDRVRTRIAGSVALGVPGARSFAELNLRTYVRSRKSGLSGVYFYSLDAASPLAVLGARTAFHLPYFLARMRRQTSAEGWVRYSSRRVLSRRPAELEAEYGPTGPVRLSRPGDLDHFVTERYCLFTSTRRGRLLVGHIHHRQWPLQPAEAEFRRNGLAASFGFRLPDVPPVLSFAKELEVYIWALRRDGEGRSV